MTGGLRRKHRNLLLAWYLILVARPLVAAELLSVTVERARPVLEVLATL
ncbi:MAG: hypothetical protein ACR2I8_05065 [Steroidobacteraceae bacterium]